MTLAPARFAVARRATAVAAARRGTRIRYSLSEPATVTLRIEKVGRRRAAGALRRRGAAGANRVRFSGRIGRRALPPGRYRLTVRAIDAAGNRSAPRGRTFRIVRDPFQPPASPSSASSPRSQSSRPAAAPPPRAHASYADWLATLKRRYATGRYHVNVNKT